MAQQNTAHTEGPCRDLAAEVLGKGDYGLPVWRGGPTLWNLGGTGPVPQPLVGMAALVISGSPSGSFFPFRKGNRLQKELGLSWLISFLPIPTSYGLGPELCHLPPKLTPELSARMIFPPGHPVGHRKTLLPRDQSQIPVQGPTVAP